MSYDPAYKNTASCTSRITFIDGANGVLRYRGYPIEQLAEGSSFLEVAYLTLKGELPNNEQMERFRHEVTHHTLVHENIRELIDGFRYDAHPMGILISTVAALSTFYPAAKNVEDPANRWLQIVRLIGKVPTLAAYAYRHRRGLPYVYPDNDLSYSGNFLNMMFKMTERRYEPNPAVEKALDVLFILHADHEQNCSATAMRGVGSSRVDPYSALAAGCAALYGPLHGGANEAVVRMLQEIGSKDNIPAFVKRAKEDRSVRLMGFGHRVYKNYDPRAKVIKKLAYEVFDAVGKNPLIDLAVELERIALEDDYFVGRALYPNVDFYSGLIYQAMDHADGHVPRPFRDRSHRGMARAVGRDAQRQRASDRAAAPRFTSAPASAGTRRPAGVERELNTLRARGPGSTNSTAMRPVRLFSLVVAITFALGTGCGPSSRFEGDDDGECRDGRDNDRDGETDCEDEGCIGTVDCTSPRDSGSDSASCTCDFSPSSCDLMCECDTDCGGVLCTDTCSSSFDGECDDGGPDSDYNVCSFGTDCGDCGPRLSEGK